MSINSEEKEYRLDSVKWLIIFALVAVGVVGNSHFALQPLLYRALALLVLAAMALVVMYHTAKGASLWSLVQGAIVELRKVVWPSRQETNQTTLIVVAVVFVMAIILWLLDTFLGYVTMKIIG